MVVKHPAQYPRSGHRELLRRSQSPLVDPEQTLSMYGDTTGTARRSYVRTLQTVGSETWRTSPPRGPAVVAAGP